MASEGLSDEEMRARPLTLEELSAHSRSAHAFWRMPLGCPDHKNVGVEATAFSNGTLELHCRSCQRLLGVLAIQRSRSSAHTPCQTCNGEGTVVRDVEGSMFGVRVRCPDRCDFGRVVASQKSPPAADGGEEDALGRRKR